MKGIDLFCASPASTAICVSLDQKSMVCHGGRALDRNNPRLIDRQRTRPTRPCSQSPSKPKSYSHKTCRKRSEKHASLSSPPGSTRYLLDDTPYFEVCSDFNTDFEPVSTVVPAEPPRSRSLKAGDSSTWSRTLVPYEPTRSRSLKADEPLIRSRHIKPEELVLRSKPINGEDGALEPRPIKAQELVLRSKPINGEDCALEPRPIKAQELVLRSKPTKDEESAILNPSRRSHEQVVALKVSLHCKGCEGKVRKHISRMEGVTSFTIDFPTKKVTVIGNVTPLGVLNSISRVKNAQFWPSPSPSPSIS